MTRIDGLRAFALSISTVCLCGSAMAQAPAEEQAATQQDQEEALGRWVELLTNSDKNKDGIATKDELSKSLQSNFNRMDRNGNGVANQKDAPSFARTRYMEAVGPIIERSDTNGDNSLSYEEFSSAPLSGFDLLDEDGDGQIEIAAMTEMFNNLTTAD